MAAGAHSARGGGCAGAGGQQPAPGGHATRGPPPAAACLRPQPPGMRSFLWFTSSLSGGHTPDSVGAKTGGKQQRRRRHRALLHAPEGGVQPGMRTAAVGSSVSSDTCSKVMATVRSNVWISIHRRSCQRSSWRWSLAF